jgi:hypothetical protein
MLHGYKRGGPAERPPNTLKLAALLSIFLSEHGECVGPYSVVTCVPSPDRVAPKAIIDRTLSIRDRFEQLLSTQTSSAGRPLDADRFRVTRDVRGERVLLIDDTLASGASLFSATAALRGAGATVVGPVVIGRHVNRDWPDTAAVLEWLSDRRWDRTRCVRCAGERKGPLGLFDL